MRCPRAGTALLEVIVALMILASAGTSALVLMSQAVSAVDQVRRAEDEMRSANALLTAVSLWPREDLDRRLGDRHQGSWQLRIDRLAPTLYVVVLRDSLDRELLRTSLHRAEQKRETP